MSGKQARNDLSWITREFEKLRMRKELLESSVGALAPLVSNLKSEEERAASHEHHHEHHAEEAPVPQGV